MVNVDWFHVGWLEVLLCHLESCYRKLILLDVNFLKPRDKGQIATVVAVIQVL